MSRVKSPQEKKYLSLKKDRRNVYGECPTSSRKNIRRAKQRSHMFLRRTAAQALVSLKNTGDADEADSLAKVKIIVAQRGSFKKEPDAPLGIVIERKSKRRTGKLFKVINQNE